MSTCVTAPTQSEGEQSTEPPTEAESATEAPAREADLPLDVVFDMLSVERRRQVLRYLREESSDTTLGDLAEHIAAIENDKPEDALSSSERKRVYVGLYQCHLPRMDDVDVIDYDSDRGTVEVGANADEVASYLPTDGDTTDDARPPTGHLPVAIAGAALFVGQAALFPHAVLLGISIGLVVTSLVLGPLTRSGIDGRWRSVRRRLDPSTDECAA